MKKTGELPPGEFIENKIFILREQKVMIGPHLADLYGIETRVLMQAVKRNRSRFPEDFMFALSREEIARISQSVISLKYAKVVYAFTEQGIAMLSGVLNSDRAVNVNFAIMRAFVKLRKTIAAHKELSVILKQIEIKVERHDEDIHAIFEAIRGLMLPPEPSPKRRIGFGAEEPRGSAGR